MEPTEVGELRTLTVLFSDMTGSVAASVGHDAETVMERVNAVLEAMADAIIDNGGVVNRYLGDGVLALFGAREARERDPSAAVAAAQEICRRVAALGVPDQWHLFAVDAV